MEALFKMFRNGLTQSTTTSARNEFRWLKESLPNTLSTSSERYHALQKLLQRRLQGEPLAYIIGTQPFGSLDLNIRWPTLIPRPETEHWTLHLSTLLKPTIERPISILDLCTGSGCIPILLCHLWPRGSVKAVGVDVSPSAVQLARENAKKFGFDNGIVEIAQRDIFERSFSAYLDDLQQKHSLALVTANPPYIDKEAYDKLPPSVKDYEDRIALLDTASATGSGLGFYYHISDLIGSRKNLMLVCEVGEGQSKSVQKIFTSQPSVQRTAIWQDPWETPRVVVAWT